ncbi:RT0821/Lpp0805 family surface protein [Rhizobium sp. SG2393]|uniref:RT0821/Lpp0805 family surface protein n=1 Tax=Rhizobium sp. SG2393 TaxID=3276279 RepID=UPI00366F9A22
MLLSAPDLMSLRPHGSGQTATVNANDARIEAAFEPDGIAVVDIAKSLEETMTDRLPRRGAASRVLLAAAISLSLSGCMGTAGDVLKMDNVDRNLTTSSVPAALDETTDEAAVRNAVSAADLESLGQTAIPWANTRSGSAGVISAVRENSDSGLTCRTFVTTRHSYEGIARFEGSACKVSDDRWNLVKFAPQG